MTSRTTFSHSWLCWPRSEKLLLLAMLSMGLLTACVSPPLYDPGAEAASTESSDPSQPDAASATLTPQPSPSASSEASTPFTFPMSTCGDQSAEPSETWYSVFIDGGNINEVRTRYCGDAISTTRKSGTASVQVASFTSYARALSLAKAIGGVVEQTAQAAPQTQDGYASSDSAGSSGANTDRSSSNATPTPQPEPAPQPTPSEAVQVGQSAYLNAKDVGASINIRQGASTNAQIQSMAYAGDRVQVANRVQGDDGYPWYEVRLESGETGWVRGDLLALQTPSYQPDPSYQAPAPAAPSYDQPPIANGQRPDPGYGSQPPLANQPGYNQAPMPQQPQPYPYPSRSGAQNGGVNGGAMPYGRSSVLATRDPGTVINIRESASLNSRVRYLANPGDPIQVSGSAQGEDGYTWYQVRFPSGAMGWVRSDLVSGN